MERAELMDALLELAREADLPVRLVGTEEGGGGAAGAESGSAIVRVRGRPWVVLSRADPVELQIDVLASGLRQHATEVLESRYLPPAVRARLERE